MLDSKIRRVAEQYGVESLEDWRDVSASDVLAIAGVGDVTLNHIRLYLANQGLSLKGDGTPEFWKQNLDRLRVSRVLDKPTDGEVCPFTVLIDTREQTPFTFRAMSVGTGSHARPLLVPTERAGLPTGDYTVRGLEHVVAIERKSVPDFYACCGRERDRFERELQRLNLFEIAGVVIEADLADLAIRPPPETQVRAKSVLRSIAAWSVRYPRVHWWPMPGRAIAERWTFRLLQRVHSEQERRAKDAGKFTEEFAGL